MILSADALLDIIKTHQQWAVVLVFALAFAESLAFVSLLIPATVILWGVGALIGVADLEFWRLWFATALGAILGDWVSYWFGLHYHEKIEKLWPINRYPHLVERAHGSFKRYGIVAVFGGRFIGPLRAFMPLVAGATMMPIMTFQLANISSGLLWAGVTLAPGAFGADFISNWLN